ncbi:4266_t:CDS:2 [Entrophospora sp. SA101]|nr:4266_t:CDS:2 [Entrophospora sp. SA101]
MDIDRFRGNYSPGYIQPQQLVKETPYSRSPELRISHKLAERKRRKEMKELFDELRDSLPVDKSLKTSKWEILSKDDKVAFKTLKESIGSDGDFWPLSSNDAISSLESISTLEDLKIKINNTTISGNQITVLKTALIYLAFLTGKWKWDREGRILDLIYPASFGTLSSQQKSIALKTVLCQNHNNKDEVILYQPNSGYVFGGNFFGTICRGLDCSSFVSYCVDSSARLGTWHMKLIYEKLLNDENKDVNDAVVKKTFSEFEAIEIRENIDNIIQKGDIVIWRGSSGHTAIFKEWISKSKQTFLGIDNNRMDDKKIITHTTLLQNISLSSLTPPPIPSPTKDPFSRSLAPLEPQHPSIPSYLNTQRRGSITDPSLHLSVPNPELSRQYSQPDVHFSSNSSERRSSLANVDQYPLSPSSTLSRPSSVKSDHQLFSSLESRKLRDSTLPSISASPSPVRDGFPGSLMNPAFQAQLQTRRHSIAVGEYSPGYIQPQQLVKETPYSRSPELRISHKLAERKRRKEMKELFDELRDSLPVDKSLKTSKWEILSKGERIK